MQNNENIVIVASGRFPTAKHSLDILDQASQIICCDEAADNLLAYGKEPDVVIGDMDSISDQSRKRFRQITIQIEEQESNDLTKAVNYCVITGYKSVTILGATGLREDHALGNISLLLEYNQKIKARMVSDYGEFSTLNSGIKVSSYPGEQISFFSTDNKVRVTSEGLKYRLKDIQLHNWWRASLNEVTGESFVLYFESEWPLILYRLFK